MKLVICSLVVLAAIAEALGTKCHTEPVSIPRGWITMRARCVGGVRRQVQLQVGAALQYLALGAHFARDDVNRPGFAALFFQAASEERDRTTSLIHYLLMRGELTEQVTTLIHQAIKPIRHKEWSSGAAALEYALQVETDVTSRARDVITACAEDVVNDYHLADYLSGAYLTHSYDAQRSLAGRAVTLYKMAARHGALGEFQYDLKLREQLP